MSGAPQDLIPAATIVLMRERPDGSAELLMIERASSMSFAAGALVFPGGRTDPGDRMIAEDRRLIAPDAPDDADECAARVAAIREALEEVGVAVAFLPDPAPAETARLRAQLGETGDFATLLSAGGYRLDLAALTLFAWWRPDFPQARNFDTRFYVARAPTDAVEEADGGESVHAVWLTAAEALAEADAGRRHIIFPTRRNLERLAACGSYAATIENARRHPARPITPARQERDGQTFLCIPEDLGYPVTSEPVAQVRRG